MRSLAAVLGAVLAGATGVAQTVAHERLLGPVMAPTGCAWSAAEQDWLTPAERACYATTPNYVETMTYVRRVEAAAPRVVRIEPFGRTGEGRELDVVVVSRDGVFDPAALHAAKRPVVLVQNSIHAGEMDGKDSCLALLRDMAISGKQAELLQRAVFVFIPIYNADGHERRSAYNRINQDGPAEIGWRGNGTNLNLNRDYMKADTPETRAFLQMWNRWQPDFFVDDHVTDGADFQYDVTFAIDDGPNVPPATAKWVDEEVAPGVVKFVDAHGHLALPTYVELVDERDLRKGLSAYDDPPRFSTGMATLMNRPAMLVELHMLKDYRTRVEGNYQTLVGLMEIVNRDADTLLELNAEADARARALPGKSYPLSVGWGSGTTPLQFKGFQYRSSKSKVSGADWVEYTHGAETMTVPLQTGYKVTDAATAPTAYIIPVQWARVIDVLRAHGVEIQHTTATWEGEIETYRCSGMHWQDSPFEGRHPTFNGEARGAPGKFGECALVKERRAFPEGSAVVRMDQRLSGVAIEWLEPKGQDSALQWGFFDPIFEQKEYGEGYVVERLAREMMAGDPALKSEFEKKLKEDKAFAASPAERLDWFYQRSEWGRANRVGEYPVGRVASLAGFAVGR